MLLRVTLLVIGNLFFSSDISLNYTRLLSLGGTVFHILSFLSSASIFDL